MSWCRCQTNIICQCSFPHRLPLIFFGSDLSVVLFCYGIFLPLSLFFGLADYYKETQNKDGADFQSSDYSIISCLTLLYKYSFGEPYHVAHILSSRPKQPKNPAELHTVEKKSVADLNILDPAKYKVKKKIYFSNYLVMK